MTEKTFLELKNVLQHYQNRQKINNTVHQSKNCNLSMTTKPFNNSKRLQKLSLSISSPFYKKTDINVPPHIRAKKVLNARSTHESYLKKGHGNYIYEKRKIIALIKKDINSPSPEKKSDKSLIDVKKFTKKIKTIHQLYSLFHIKCDFSKPKLDCFNKEFQNFLKKHHMQILKGLQEIEDRLILANVDVDGNARKEIVDFIEQEIEKKSENIEKKIKTKVEEVIRNKNKARIYQKWAIQVSKVIKRYKTYKNFLKQNSLNKQTNKENKKKDNELKKSQKDKKLEKRRLKRTTEKKKSEFASPLIFSDSSSSYSDRSEQERKKNFKSPLEKRKYSILKNGISTLQNIDQNKLGFEKISKQTSQINIEQNGDNSSMNQTQRSDEEIREDRSNSHDDQNSKNKQKVTQSKGNIKESFLKEKKIKRGSLVKKSLLENKIEKILNESDEDQSLNKFVRYRSKKETKKVNLKKTKLIDYESHNHLGKQVENMKYFVDKNKNFIQRVENYLIKNKMKDSILLKSDSVLTLKRKASNLMDFASIKKGAKKRIKKYLKLNEKLKRESHENLHYQGFEDVKYLDMTNCNDFYFYDLQHTNYSPFQNEQYLTNQDNFFKKFSNIPHYTSQKVKKSPEQYFQDYLINNQIKDKKEQQEDKYLCQKNLETKTQLKFVPYLESPQNNIIRKQGKTSKLSQERIKTTINKNLQYFKNKLNINF